VGRSFKFQKRRQLFIATNYNPLSIVAVCVSNPDCFGIAVAAGGPRFPL
jgi:hypothetical protein